MKPVSTDQKIATTANRDEKEKMSVETNK